MAKEQRQGDEQEIVPSMRREATEGKLGEQDTSPTQGTSMVKNQQATIEAVTVFKGMFLKKVLNVPADRLHTADLIDGSHATTTTDAKEEEREVLAKARSQAFPSEAGRSQESLLDQVEQSVPTPEGMRQMERAIHTTPPPHTFLWGIGPGLLSGTSGNDPSAVMTV